jgi:hypothetical protein
MSAVIVRKRRPRWRLRRLRMPAGCGPVGQTPPGRPDFDDEACELIGPGNERFGEGA